MSIGFHKFQPCFNVVPCVLGGYEMSTILVLQDERIMAAIRCMQLKWLHEQHAPEEDAALD